MNRPCEEGCVHLQQQGGIDDVLGLTPVAAPPLQSDVPIRRICNPPRRGEIGRPRGKRPAGASAGARKKLKSTRQAGIGESDGRETTGGKSDGAYSRERAGIVLLGEASRAPVQTAGHHPARHAGNLFFLVFFGAIFICFCFWWNMKHHVRVQ